MIEPLENKVASSIRSDFDAAHALAAALQFHRSGQIKQALAIYRQVLQTNPNHADALHMVGVIALQTGQYSQAQELISKALANNPKQAECYLNLGHALKATHRFDDALANFSKALQLKPQFAEAYYGLGKTLLAQRKWQKAEEKLRLALQHKHPYPEAQQSLGIALKAQGRLDEAVARFRQALDERPDYLDALNNLGNTLRTQGKLVEAHGYHQRAIELKPDDSAALINFANSLAGLGRLDEAINHYRRALKRWPQSAEIIYNLGNALLAQGKTADAIDHYHKAAALKPQSPPIQNNLGNALVAQGRLAEALDCYRQALVLQPDYREALDNSIDVQLKLCDWSAVDSIRSQLLAPALIDSPNLVPVRPFLAIRLPIPVSAAERQTIARATVRSRTARLQGVQRFVHRPHARSRLRIGYASTDFHDHATSHLIQGLFSRHDRERFEVYAYALGKDDGSVYRQRIMRDCDQFRDARLLNSIDLATAIHTDSIDILIDLNGHSAVNRIEAFALKPAPIQVNYLAYPGTSGANFMDYILTDRIVTPPEDQPFFDERFVYLPHSYQVNDRDRAISAEPPARVACGLPESGFVFCCFNNHYKIEPRIFAVWMDILKRTEDSVLWLLDGADALKRNLHGAARQRGVAPERLVFAPRIAVERHLARHRLADLFLDTYYYNAHTTASDALWAGLPVLTCPGDSFAARVGKSLLHAVGLPELAVADLAAYTETAVRLARNPDELRALKERLAANRQRCPLFDTDRFARDLEKAYLAMWEVHRAGEAPKPIIVPA